MRATTGDAPTYMWATTRDANGQPRDAPTYMWATTRDAPTYMWATTRDACPTYMWATTRDAPTLSDRCDFRPDCYYAGGV